MPIRSAAQYGAMAAAAHGKGKIGIPRTVAREYVKATPPAARRRLARAQAKRRKLKRAKGGR